MMNKRVKESFYRDKLANSIEGAKTEVRCGHGSIDILTPTELIEVKRLSDWKSGVGQLATYGIFYPDRAKRLHVLTPSREINEQLESVIKPACASLNVLVTHESECDRAITVYTIGNRQFHSVEEIKTCVDHIRIQYKEGVQPMSQEHKEFMLALINLPSWASERFGGTVVDVRVIGDHWRNGRRLSVGHFQAKSESRNWSDISIGKYIEQSLTTAKHHVIYLPQKHRFVQ